MADIVGIAASIVGIVQLTIVIVDTSVQYYSGVHNAHKSMTNLLREVLSLKSVLSHLHGDIFMNPDIKEAFGATNYAIYEEFGPQTGSGPTTGSVLVTECHNTLAEIYSRLEMGISSGRPHFRPKSLLWPFSEKEVEKEIARIHRYRSVLQALLAVDTLVLSAKTHLELVAAQKEQALWRESEEEEKMLRWLSSLNFNLKHADVVSRRHEGTGLWLLTHPVFSEWLKASSSTCKILWCPGNPGVGKTVLASLVIDYLMETIHPSRGAIAYIYCNYEDRAAQTAPELVGSICRQLITYTTTRPPALQAAYQKSRYGRTLLTLEEHVRLLMSIVELFSDVYIVVDAVDELDEGSSHTRNSLLKSLSRLMHPSIHIFVTSRPHLEDIGKSLIASYRLNILAHEDDVRSFLMEKLSTNDDIKEILDGEDDFQQHIVSTIISKADKQFLLSALHMYRLCDCTCKAELEEALDDMTMILDDAYSQALQRIEEQAKPRRNLALNILMMLSCSMRPMRVNELQEALAIEPQAVEISKGLLRPERILNEVCVGLVSIDVVSQTIRLVHFTVQEFFEKRRDYFFEIEGDTQGRLMASKCLTYLQFGAFAGGPCDNDNALSARFKTHHFFHYASSHWGDHARGENESLILDSAFNFVSRQSTYLTASIQAQFVPLAIAQSTASDMSSSYSQDYPRDMEGLHLAATFDLPLLAEKLLAAGASVDSKTSYGETALHKAASKGNTRIIKILLEHKAGINTASSFLRRQAEPVTPIEYCRSDVYQVHLVEQETNLDQAAKDRDVVKLQLDLAEAAKDHDYKTVLELLQLGVNAHAIGERGRTALHWAVFNNLEDMVRTLLDHGAKVNTFDGQDRSRRTPLLEAARKPMSSTKVMAMLLERGANPNLQCTQWGWNYAPLHEVAIQGDCAKAALLLEFGANPRILDRDGREAIDIAASKKNIPLVQIIGGAKRGHGETALHLAAAKGHDDVARLLLTSGAEKEALTSIGETPLHWAASKGQLSIASLLINQGANITAKTASGETPLHIAAAKGNANVVQCLLDEGADINALSMAGQTPLYAAAFAGSGSVVELLLKRGANIEARAKHGATAFIGAAGQGNTNVASVLLDHKAEIDAHDGYDGKTALHRAVQRGNLEVVKLLLQKGADIESKDGDQNTPLRLASSVPDPRMTSPDGSGGILECLLKAGAQTEAVDRYGETPLQRAAFKGEVRNVRVLLQHGANPMAEDVSHRKQRKRIEDFLQSVVAREGGETGKHVLVDIRGWPAVVQAALAGNPEIVQLLVADGVGVNVQQYGIECSKLIALAEYRREANHRKKLAGSAAVVEGGWTPVEVKSELE